MKLIVFSDSHGNDDVMINVINYCKTDDTVLVHLGDMVSDFRRVSKNISIYLRYQLKATMIFLKWTAIVNI